MFLQKVMDSEVWDAYGTLNSGLHRQSQ